MRILQAASGTGAVGRLYKIFSACASYRAYVIDVKKKKKGKIFSIVYKWFVEVYYNDSSVTGPATPLHGVDPTRKSASTSYLYRHPTEASNTRPRHNS